MLPFDPKKPLFGFTAKFPHAKRRIHLFADDQFLYFRPKNAPEDWWGALWPSLLLGFPKERKLIIRIEREIIEGHFFRVWAFKNEHQKQLWQVHWHPKMGCFFPQNHIEQGAYFFPRQSEANIFKSSTRSLYNQFAQGFHDEQSDTKKASTFLALNAEERSWLSIEWVKGSRRELESVLSSALYLDAEVWNWWKGEKFVLQWNRSSLWIGFGSSGRHARFEGTAKLLLPLQRLIERATDCNHSFYALPLGRRDDWAPPWRIDYEEHMNVCRATSATLEVSPPTQHERLEAALFLRDWLEHNAPDLLSDWFPDAL